MNEQITDFDFLSPEVSACPYRANQVAREQAPVYRLPGTDMFYVSSHALVKEALRRHHDFSNDFMADIEGGLADDDEVQAIIRNGNGWPERNTLLTNDPPDHARFRKLVNSAFSLKRVEKLAPWITDEVNHLLDRFIDKGHCDFVADFALRLPMVVIAQLLGLPQKDLPLFKAWSDAFTDRLGGLASRERLLECTHLILDYQHYISREIEARRLAPRDDMLSDLVHARVGDERSLDMPELLTICHELMVAGNETTANTISDGLLLLLTNPQQMALIRKNPALMPAMVEEMLRVITPAQAILRVVKNDTELGGVAIAAGSKLVLRFVSANRDACVFSQPESFIIDRDDVDRHLSFGQGGRHICIGLMLARKELTIVFEQVLKRLSVIRLAANVEDLTYTPNLLLRSLQSLPIEFDQAG